MLILTCAIQMINVIAIELGIRDQNISAIVCVCHLCLRSQYSVLSVPDPRGGKRGTCPPEATTRHTLPPEKS